MWMSACFLGVPYRGQVVRQPSEDPVFPNQDLHLLLVQLSWGSDIPHSSLTSCFRAEYFRPDVISYHITWLKNKSKVNAFPYRGHYPGRANASLLNPTTQTASFPSPVP